MGKDAAKTAETNTKAMTKFREKELWEADRRGQMPNMLRS